MNPNNTIENSIFAVRHSNDSNIPWNAFTLLFDKNQSAYDFDALCAYVEEEMKKPDKDQQSLETYILKYDEFLIVNAGPKGAPPKKVVPPVANPTQSTNITPYTAFYSILKDTPIPGNADLFMNELLVPFMEVGKFKDVGDMFKAATFLVQTFGLIKGAVGALDTAAALDMSGDNAKAMLASMNLKTQKFISTQVLVTKLLEYQFIFSTEVEDKIIAEKGAMRFEIDYQEKTLLSIDDGGFDTSFNITCEGVTLQVDAYGMLYDDTDKINQFFEAWNSATVKDEYVYVPIEDDLYEDACALVAVYDIKYVDEKWTITRADKSKTGKLTTVYGTYDKNEILKDWDVCSKMMNNVAALMSRNNKNLTHYVDMFNAFLIAYDEIVGDDNITHPNDDFYDWLKFALSNEAAALANKAKTQFKTTRTTIPLVEAHKQAIDLRNKRKLYRNVGPREILAKNLFDALLPLGVSPLCTARKFIDIMAKNPHVYPTTADVYGCAKMHFYSALVENPFVKDAPGQRHFYDNQQKYVRSFCGHQIINDDFYAIAPGSGSGKSLIDDINGLTAKELKVSYDMWEGDNVSRIADVTYKAQCMTHKIRVAHAAHYDNIILKMMVEHIKDYTADPGWLVPLAQYGTVIFDVPGKAQSGEFYIYASKRMEKITKGAHAVLRNNWLQFAIKKVTVMSYAHALMDAATMRTPHQKRGFLYDERMLNDILGIKLTPSQEQEEAEKSGRPKVRFVDKLRSVCMLGSRSVLPFAGKQVVYRGPTPLGQVFGSKTEAEMGVTDVVVDAV
jgi:hypothetical protein